MGVELSCTHSSSPESKSVLEAYTGFYICGLARVVFFMCFNFNYQQKAFALLALLGSSAPIESPILFMTIASFASIESHGDDGGLVSSCQQP